MTSAVSFAFAKKSSTSKSVLSEKFKSRDKNFSEDVRPDDKIKHDFVTEVNRKDGVKSSVKKDSDSKRRRVIPCAKNRSLRTSEKKLDGDDLMAVNELMKDAEKFASDTAPLDVEKKTIDLSTEKSSSSSASIGSQSSQSDYENVPIQGFGMALLRGMGIDESKLKDSVSQNQPIVRPKGLGLGAKRPSTLEELSKLDSKDEKLEMKLNAFIKIVSGKYSSKYGIIKGLDGDAGRVFVQLESIANNKSDPISVSENAIQLVTKADYKMNSKVINNEMYEEYSRRKTKKSHHTENADSTDPPNSNDVKRSRITEPSESKNLSLNHSEGTQPQRFWLRPELKVRFIDKQYRGGKFYKCKMVVVDVVSRHQCICKFENNILDEIHSSQLETVIPRGENAIVMILRDGDEHQGSVGNIVKKDKSRQMVTIQLLRDKNVLLDFTFDDICEYVGNYDQDDF